MRSLTQLGFAAMLMLVLLRVAIGWHFFKEGTKKYQDPDFSSAGFLRDAKGPLADFYHDAAGAQAHEWDRWMAIPRKDAPDADADTKPVAAADADPNAIPADAPYKDWAESVIRDWKLLLQKANGAGRYNNDQAKEIAKVFDDRSQQLRDYLEEATGDVYDYQHELYRLEQMEQLQTADDVPYQKTRIEQKRYELLGTAAKIQGDVEKFEEGLINDVLGKLDPEQQERVLAALDDSPTSKIDTWVTYLHIGIGVCLIVGLFTRLSALAGGLFLCSVVASQPFWVAGAAPTYYQWVELFACFVLATTHAGKWGGLDYFLHAMVSKCCGGNSD